MKVTFEKIIYSATMLLLFFVVGCNITVPDFTKIHPLTEKKIEGEGPHKILIMEISGAITRVDYLKNIQGKPKINIVARVKEELQLAQKDANLKAIILLIDSPGGEVTASDIVYHELQMFKARQSIPIITCIVSVGASGAYYIAMASDKIVAHPTAIVGSIGVIINSVNVTGLMEKLGIQSVNYKSGRYKDMGSPLKPADPEERRLFEQMILSMHQQFIDIVASGRKMEPGAVKELAQGKVYTAAQARENGLIDKIGYIEDAINLAKEQAGISNASIIMYNRAGDFRDNYYNKNQSISSQFLGLDIKELISGSQPETLYRWNP